MKPKIKELRLEFYTQTNVKIRDEEFESHKDTKSCSSSWQKHALWLENFQAEKLNLSLLQNGYFSNYNAIKIGRV